MQHWLLSLTLVLLAATPLSGQTPAASFEALLVALPGDARVVLTLSSGRCVAGRLAAMEPTRLAIAGDGDARWFDERNVARVDHRQRDSILDGLLIGAAAGGAIFLKYRSANALCQVNCQFTSGALALVGGGAALGALIDARLARTTTVYERPAARASPVVRLAVDPIARAALVRVTF